MAERALYTIGYQGKALDELIAMLSAARVARVIDIRSLPLSRRRGFSKTPLGAALRAAGIDYVHLRAAGNPYRDQRHTLTTGRLLAKYERHLRTAADVVDTVADAARGCRAALLCYEGDPATCHRSLLAPRVAARFGCAVVDL